MKMKSDFSINNSANSAQFNQDELSIKIKQGANRKHAMKETIQNHKNTAEGTSSNFLMDEERDRP